MRDREKRNKKALKRELALKIAEISIVIFLGASLMDSFHVVSKHNFIEN